MILESAPGPLAQAVGWALLHLLWQGTAIAALLGITLPLLSGRSANLRYTLSCVALALIVACGVVTAFRSYPAGPAAPTATARPQVAPLRPATPVAATAVAPLAARVDRLAGLVRATNDALPAIVTLWLVGVALLSLRLIVQWRRTRRLVTRDATPACEPWLSVAKRLSVALGVRRAVRLFESTAIRIPAAVGLLRPVILLPASAIAGLSPVQLEMILAHELAHIRRHDFLVNLLQSAVETLLFYHPAVWWISRQVRIERENCCDDLAVSVCGTPLQYARALTRLEELRAEELPLAVSANGGSLLERVRRIVRDSTATTGHARGAAAVALLTCMLLALAGPSVSAFGRRQPSGDLARLEEPAREPRGPAATKPSGRTHEATHGVEGHSSAADTETQVETQVESSEPGGELLADAGAKPAATPNGAPHKGKIRLTLDELIELRSQGMTPSELLELRFVFPGLSVGDAVGLHNVGASPERIRELRAMGLEITSPDEASGLAAVGVSPEFIREMREAGLPVRTAEEAQGLAAVGVTPDFISEMRAAGLHVKTAGDAQGLAAVGVTPDFISEMRAAGLHVKTAGDAQGLAAVGVTPDFISEMRAAGLAVETAGDAQGLAAVGVTPDFISDMRAAGLAVKTAGDAQGLRAVGVTAEFVREMRAAGLPVKTAGEAQGLAAVGVSAEFIREIKATGLRIQSPDEVQSLAAVGVTPEYVREMKQAGVDLRYAREAQELRVHNVTPEFVRRLARAGFKNLSVEELSRLGVAGLSRDFVEEMSKYRTP